MWNHRNVGNQSTGEQSTEDSLTTSSTDSSSTQSSGGEATRFESKFFNEFRVTGILGEGGFGCVFEAENKYDDWTYAVKRIAVDAGSDETLDRALREVRAMAQLDHPNIVRYNGTWMERPPVGWQLEADEKMLRNIEWWERRVATYEANSVFIYIQMQMCKFSLDAWLMKNRTQSSRDLDRMKYWFKQIVSAVEYIHEKNLIHRDLKPCNILFADENILKLCDLGIATERVIEDGEEIAVTRTCIGTLMYMSPEQRSKRSKYSSKTDIFTLGLIFGELCFAMTYEERQKFFKRCRRGKKDEIIKDARAAEFIELITQKEPENRPTCAEILAHPFLVLN